MANERLVLDASYALELILPTHDTWRRETVALFHRIAAGDVQAHVPWLFFAECAATVTRKVRGAAATRLDPEEGRAFLEALDLVGLQVEQASDGAGALHAHALRLNAGVYDALYLTLAKRLSAPLATRDRGSITAAKAAGVHLFDLHG